APPNDLPVVQTAPKPTPPVVVETTPKPTPIPPPPLPVFETAPKAVAPPPVPVDTAAPAGSEKSTAPEAPPSDGLPVGRTGTATTPTVRPMEMPRVVTTPVPSATQPAPAPRPEREITGAPCRVIREAPAAARPAEGQAVALAGFSKPTTPEPTTEPARAS